MHPFRDMELTEIESEPRDPHELMFLVDDMRFAWCAYCRSVVIVVGHLPVSQTAASATVKVVTKNNP
jgi:hypothetical protein